MNDKAILELALEAKANVEKLLAAIPTLKVVKSKKK